MAANPNMRLVHLDWGDKTPSLHLALDQERLRLIGLTPKEAGQQLQSYLNGTPATQVRENLRSVDVLLRSPGPERRSLGEIGDLTLATKDGRQVPLSQVARLESRNEDAVLKRYNRETYIRVQGDVLDGKQPPDIHAQVFPLLDPIKAKLPPGYRIDTAGAVEESAKAMNVAGGGVPDHADRDADGHHAPGALVRDHVHGVRHRAARPRRAPCRRC